MERVNFYNQRNFKCDAEKTFISQKNLIHELIPNADVQHVGSTAIPHSLTKGDLDIQVRVSEIQFNKAVKALSAMYESNEGSIKTNSLEHLKMIRLHLL
ncbi:GrpB family protein [Pseudogracilibacillus sp. SE30717A]|uniref:GrpB family protein n=1 Tax=Pseudogracilibacillus sp. SE30717A TaxID=3098293 RepID=UPI00300E583A